MEKKKVKFKRAKKTPKTFRPCLVISDNIQNEFNDLIVVVPITTENVEIVEPFEVFVKNAPETGLDYPSKIQFIFPMTIDKELHFREAIGSDKQRRNGRNQKGLKNCLQCW